MNEKDGFDSHKRMGNSAQRGVGVNSPAMMEARKGFANKKHEVAKKMKGKYSKELSERRAKGMVKAPKDKIIESVGPWNAHRHPYYGQALGD